MDLLAGYGSDDAESENFASQPHKRAKLAPRSDSALVQQQSAPTTSLPPAAALLSDLAGNSSTTSNAAAPARIKLDNGFVLPPEPARVRIFPHVEGNFATVVYITVDEAAQAQLQALATSLMSQCPAATTAAAAAGPQDPAASSTLHLWPTFALAPPAAAASAAAAEQGSSQAEAGEQQQLPLHMSISRTVPIKRVQAESLQAALTKQLRPFKACRVQLQGLRGLVNDAGARSFVGIKVAVGEKQVVRMVEAVNRAFTLHGLQTFYENPLPHVSLAWTPGDQAMRLQPWLDSVPHQPIHLQVSQVVCQVGKMRHVVWQG